MVAIEIGGDGNYALLREGFANYEVLKEGERRLAKLWDELCKRSARAE